MVTPQLTYTSQYSLSQKFSALNVDVKGQGDLSGVLSECIDLKLHEQYTTTTNPFLGGVNSKFRVKFTLKGNRVQLKKVQYKMKIDNGRFKISSLSNTNDGIGSGNSQLFTEIANNFINSEPNFILRKIEPSMEKKFVDIVTETINALCRDATIDDFYTA